MRPLTGLICVACVALPWYVLVAMRTDGQFLETFFFEHHWGRVTRTFEGHRGTVFFYPLTMLVGFFPWSVFAGPTTMELIARIRRSLEGKIGFVFCTCWILFWMVAFSFVRTKLPPSIPPFYPALALTTAVFLQAWLRGSSTHHFRWPQISLVVLIVA